MRKSSWKQGAVALTVVAVGLPIGLGASSASAADTDVRITEVASRGNNTPLGDDWIELTNTSATTVDLTGWRVDDDSNTFATGVPISGVSSLAPGESAVLVTESTSSAVAAFAGAWFGGTLPAGLHVGWLDGSGLGLGAGGDQVNVFNAAGTRVANVVFASAGTATPAATFDNSAGALGTIATLSQVGVNGAFASSNGAEIGSPGTAPTPGPVEPVFGPWPGGASVRAIEASDFGEDMSGLDYEDGAEDVLWAARNKAGTLFRLLFDGTNWVPDAANDWTAGKELRYPGGTGHPDSEGVTFAGTSSVDGIYIASERNNDNSGVSRNSILRYDVSAPGAALVAAQEWNLTGDLPATGANLGFEAVTWIDDAFLVANGFVDESTGSAYNPAAYPDHGAGVFFVALEQTGQIYAYVLRSSGEFTRVATIASGLAVVTDLQYDRDEQKVWAECDNTCSGRLTVLGIDATTGTFTIAERYERPAGLGDNNNEGFAIAPATVCVDGLKPVYWADDAATNGVSIVQGSLACSDGPDPVVPEFPIAALGVLSSAVILGGWFLVRRRGAVQPA